MWLPAITVLYGYAPPAPPHTPRIVHRHIKMTYNHGTEEE